MERILKYASLIYALLVFVGYINLHSYYGAFGIDIWAYLGTSDLLISFMSLGKGLLFSGITIMFYIAIIASLFADAMDDTADESYLDDSWSFTEILDFLWSYKAFRLGLVMLALGLFICAIGSDRTFSVGWDMAYMFVGMTLTFGGLAIFLGVWKMAIIKLRMLIAIIGLYCVFAWLNSFNRMTAHDRMAGMNVQDAFVATESGTSGSDSVNVYVGQCSGAVFFFNRRNGMTRAIRSSEIKSFWISSYTVVDGSRTTSN